jgi:uncharacterized repeat protein (TIGR03806 family)
MTLPRRVVGLLSWVCCVPPLWGQPFGLSNRVGHSSLRLPPAPPTYGYALTNAFGDLRFTNPTALASPPGEANRLFIVEQIGVVAVITNLAAPTRTVFLDLTARVSGGIGGQEQGLLGLAFHPGYATNGFFFLYFTASATTTAGSGRHQVLSRFRVSANTPHAADPGSEVTLLTMFDEHSDHNGGDLHFGPDGYLYVSLGDEGGQGDSYNNSQRIDKDFWSSILRLDVDVPPRPTSLPPNAHPANTNHPGRVIHYRVPADNPFVGATSFNGSAVNPASVRTEMFAVGFRNPWRFSFDPATGRIFCGDVGSDTWEEINVITRGGNYGWAYREATNAGPKAASTPPGFASIPPILTYRHGTAANQGNAVMGGVVYRGHRLAALHGQYVFGDYVSGNVWALGYDGTRVTSFVRLADDGGIAAYGLDPSNGDVLTADQSEETIKRLIAVPAGGPPPPPTLADTGVFTNLSALTPHAGFVPYELNVPFWSDHASKTRWFYIPPSQRIVFNPTNNWLFPTGSVWVKHFELELTNGVAASRRRLETRLLVRYPGADGTDVYGLTYRWGGSRTNAALVPDGGLDETFVVNDGGILRTQVWRYPGRSECLFCHTRANLGGLALGFNTPQLNRDFNYGGVIDNQIRAMNHAGYFTAPVTNLHALRALAHPTNEAASVEQRVRSYLAANCAQCHQPGGNGLGQFDARLFTPLSATRLVNGPLLRDEGDARNKVIAPGFLAHSMLLSRVTTLQPGRRMPPLASSVIDTQAVALLTRWINDDLPAEWTFPEWQDAYFGSTNAASAQAGADPDGDRASNFAEYLTGYDPLNAADAYWLGVNWDGRDASLAFPRLINRRIELQCSTNPLNPAAWQFLDVPGNRPFISATSGVTRVPILTTNRTPTYYRARVYEP